MQSTGAAHLEMSLDRAGASAREGVDAYPEVAVGATFLLTCNFARAPRRGLLAALAACYALRVPLATKWGETLAGYSGQLSDALRTQAEAVGLVSSPPPPPARTNSRLRQMETVVVPPIALETQRSSAAKLGRFDTVIDAPLVAAR